MSQGIIEEKIGRCLAPLEAEAMESKVQRHRKERKLPPVGYVLWQVVVDCEW